MNTSQEIFEQIEQHWLAFKENHERFADKGVKAAEIKKLASKYRSTQLAETKA
jgi:hypothetical protein